MFNRPHSLHEGATMPSPESQNVIAMLRAQPIAVSSDPAAMRASFEQMTAILPVAGDAIVEATVANGVPAEWVSTPGADATRAVLYIHGGAWVIGSPTTHRALTAEISRASGDSRRREERERHLTAGWAQLRKVIAGDHHPAA